MTLSARPTRFVYRVGPAGQQAAVDERLPGWDNLRMFGRLYHLPESVVRRRAGELLEQFGLSGAAGQVVRTYSGGMRRRLDIAASLIVAPLVLFLEEPTTGAFSPPSALLLSAPAKGWARSPGQTTGYAGKRTQHPATKLIYALRFLQRHQHDAIARETLNWVTGQRRDYLNDDELRWVRENLSAPTS